MTENEAIRDLQYLIGEYSAYPPETGVNATVGSLQYCITALKEIQQYREIGTVEECREAVERQKPKMPDYEGDGYADGEMVYDTWICPNCGKKYEVDYDDYKHCPNCGQAIDENLEGMEDE